MDFLDLNLDADKILKLLAAYGMVQILAQDLGVKTGKEQRDLVQSQPVQAILLFAGAYSVMEDYKLALLVTGMYYGLKMWSTETATVCFEDV